MIHQEKCKGLRHVSSPAHMPKPYFNAQVNKANKCIGLLPRIEKGCTGMRCSVCGRAMHVGFIDDQESSVFKLVKRFGVHCLCTPSTAPNPTCSIVPVLGPRVEMPNGEHTADPKISMTQLEQLFGKQVREVLKTLQAEREKKIKNQPSELMDIPDRPTQCGHDDFAYDLSRNDGRPSFGRPSHINENRISVMKESLLC